MGTPISGEFKSALVIGKVAVGFERNSVPQRNTAQSKNGAVWNLYRMHGC